MLIAYLDESYTRDRYYIAAYVVEESQMLRVDEAFKRAHEYASGFGIEPGVEYHAHKIMTGCDGWDPVRGKARAAISIYKNALREIVEAGGRMFIRGVDVQRLHARYSYPHPPHRIALQYLLEELQRYAAPLKQTVRVIADHVAGEQAHHDQMRRYREIGTPGYKPTQLEAIQLPIEFEDSREHPGLQAADLIAYLYRRRDGHVETDARAEKAVTEMWDLLRPAWEVVWVWRP